MARIFTLHVAECSEDHVAAAWALIDSKERAQAERFVFPEHRRLYTLAHGMTRAVLGEALAADPRGLHFSIGSHGKPSIPGLDFNLSHTDGLVAIALGSAPLGVDVEDTLRRTDVLGVCDRFFSPSEVAALRALPASAQRERFFRYWTLKEAYIKARGLGLAIPLEDFSFDLAHPDIRVSFVPRLGDDPARWRFYQAPIGRFMLALCADATDTETVLSPFAF